MNNTVPTGEEVISINPNGKKKNPNTYKIKGCIDLKKCLFHGKRITCQIFVNLKKINK